MCGARERNGGLLRRVCGEIVRTPAAKPSPCRIANRAESVGAAHERLTLATWRGGVSPLQGALNAHSTARQIVGAWAAIVRTSHPCRTRRQIGTAHGCEPLPNSCRHMRRDRKPARTVADCPNLSPCRTCRRDWHRQTGCEIVRTLAANGCRHGRRNRKPATPCRTRAANLSPFRTLAG